MSAPRPHPLRSAASVAAVLALDATLLALGLGGFDLLRRDPRALALLAIWAMAGVTLAILRPVRGQDVALSRPDPLAMLALFFIPLVTPMIAAFGARHALYPLYAAHSIAWTGVALVAAGLALRIAAMAQLGRRFSPFVAVQKEHVLETGGLYAFVRHPGYSGALLSCLGSALAFGSALALPLPAFMLVALLARIHREEALLAGHFGAQWQAYAKRTGALLPRPAWPGRS